MTILQVIAAVIFIGMVLYFLYDVIVHAIQRGGSKQQIITRVLIWILIFVTVVVINILINADWTPGKWIFKISF